MIGPLLVIAQMSIVAHAPDSASTCEAVEISVAVSTRSKTPPTLIAPSLAPFDVLRSSAVPRITYDGQRNGMIAEFRYVLTTDHVGKFSIPAFEARSGNLVARSRPVAMSIYARTSRIAPTVVARARVDTGLAVNFRALTLPETVFVGQQANYEVAVFLNETVRERLRRNPTFFPPDMQSMLAYDMPTRGDPPRRSVGSGCFDALVYQRALFPLMAGRFAIPPAQLVYSLPLSSSFFSREETHELQTDSTVIIAVEPPLRGRPTDYGGAVGKLSVAARLDTVGSRVGDPMRLTVRVTGTGNVKLFPRPQVGVSWGSLVKGDERVNVDENSRRIAGAKEFDWVLTPKIAGELDLPPIRYTYFNPDTRQYEVASTNTARVRVRPGTLASSDTARTDALLALRTQYRGAPRPPVHEHPLFWALLALVPVPAFTLRVRERKRRSVPRTRDRITRLGDLSKDAKASGDAYAIRRAYAGALAERLRLDPESFTRPGALARALRRRGVTNELAYESERFLRQLDEAAFSRKGKLVENAAQRASKLFQSIDSEALPPSRIPMRAVCVIGLLAIGVATANALNADAAREAFHQGIEAYDRHDFVASREAFIEAVSEEPRAPDAWADLGTAAWAAADTARSVAAWQRALRIEPFASDVRDRVELAHALPWTSAGFVPALPPAWLFNLAAFVWIAAWGSAAYHVRRGAPFDGRRVVMAAVIAGVFALGGFALAERFSGRNLAVMRHTASLTNEPQLGSERGATAMVGEVVRVTGRQGAWSRVVLDDGRDGWIENAVLMSLDTRDVDQIRVN